MGFELDEASGKACGCGCGEKADVVINIGKTAIPITNDCMYKMVLELFSLTEKTGKKSLIDKPIGSFKDRYGVLTEYGLASDKNDNALVFHNSETAKGIRIEWEDLYNFVRRTDIND